MLLRIESGKMQNECATALGVDKGKYNKWEKGVNRPDYETVRMIATHYNVTTDYLLGHSEAKKPEYTMLIEDLGLTDESIDEIITLGTDDHPKIPLGGVLSDGSHVIIDQSADKRSLLDVLNSFMATSNVEKFFNIIRTLTSPIGEREGAAQWEADEHAIFIPGQTPFDSQYEGMLYRELGIIIRRIKEDAFKKASDEKKDNIKL